MPERFPSSVIAERGNLYLTGFDFVESLRAQDREVQWRYPLASPAPALSWSDGVILVGSGSAKDTPPAGAANALRASDGKLLWRVQTGDSVDAAPAIADGIAYIASEDQSVYAVRISDGGLLWHYQTTHALSTSPVAAGHSVYVAESGAGTGNPCVDALGASDGTLLWHHCFTGLVSGVGVQAPPFAADNAVYVGSQDGNVYALGAADGAVLWRFQTGGPVYARPILAGGTTYVASRDGYLYALKESSGSLLWHVPAGGLPESPVVSDGTVYAGVIVPAAMPSLPASGRIIAVRTSDGALHWTYTLNATPRDPTTLAPAT